MAGHIKSLYGIVVSWLIAPSDIKCCYIAKSREFHILDRRYQVETLKKCQKTNPKRLKRRIYVSRAVLPSRSQWFCGQNPK